MATFTLPPNSWRNYIQWVISTGLVSKVTVYGIGGRVILEVYSVVTYGGEK
jgi:hypothetical protein